MPGAFAEELEQALALEQGSGQELCSTGPEPFAFAPPSRTAASSQLLLPFTTARAFSRRSGTKVGMFNLGRPGLKT